jgi:protein TonB
VNSRSLHLATAWVDKELHRWGVCLLIVLALHAGAIAGFETWKAVDHSEMPSGAMMIDLGPLPGPGGHGAGNKPVSKPHQGAAKPQARADVKKQEYLRRIVKLRAEVAHLLKPRHAVEHIAAPSAVALPKPDSSTLVASASAVPAPGVGNARSGSGAGGSTGPSGGCCGGSGGGGPIGFGQGGAVTWQGLLLAHLEANKRYPPAAQERGEQGVAYLRFAMDRQGKVLSFSLEKGSGFADLDQETLDLIQRSQPLPPPPADIAGNVIELVVPVQFELEQAD